MKGGYHQQEAGGMALSGQPGLLDGGERLDSAAPGLCHDAWREFRRGGITGWIGGVLGVAAGGYMRQNLGLGLTLIVGGCLMLASVALLLPIQTRPR